MNLIHGLKKRMQRLIPTLASKGFTLIEVLVSITILSLMAFGIISFSRYSADTSDRTIRDDKDAMQIETAMARLEWDVSQLYSPFYFDIALRPEQMTPEEGEIYNELIDTYQSNQRFSQISYNGIPVPIYENPEKSELIIFTLSNRRKVINSKQSRFAWIRYSLASGEEQEDVAVGENGAGIDNDIGPKNILIRQLYNTNVFAPEDVPWNRVKTQVLMRGVDTINFEFWNPQTAKWTENLDTVEQGIHLIHALKVKVNYVDVDGVELFTERIFRPLFPEFRPEDLYRFLKPKRPARAEEGGA